MKNIILEKLEFLHGADLLPLFAVEVSGYRHGASHSHDAFELIFHETGDGVDEFPDGITPFCSSSWSLIMPQVIHRQTNNGAYTDLCLLFKLKEKWDCPFSHVEFAPSAEAYPAISELKKLISVGNIPQSGWKSAECAARTMLILATLMQSLARQEKEEKSQSLNYAERAEEMIRQNGFTDLSLSETAENLGISPDHLRHSYLQVRGHSLKYYKDRIRLEYASYLLRYSDMPIREISHRCGFRSASHFSLFFRNSMHILPENYRNEKR